MAIKGRSSFTVAEPWAVPVWPSTAPTPADAELHYGVLADELVLRFPSPGGRATVSVAINTPEVDYVYVLADERTGAVLGIQVDNLRPSARRRHPAWGRLAQPRPPLTAVADFLTDVTALFRAYGAGDAPPADDGRPADSIRGD